MTSAAALGSAIFIGALLPACSGEVTSPSNFAAGEASASGGVGGELNTGGALVAETGGAGGMATVPSPMQPTASAPDGGVPDQPQDPDAGDDSDAGAPDEPEPIVAPECSESKKRDILSGSGTEVLTCSLTLAANDVVRKQLVIEGAAATGVNLRCNGATIDAGTADVIEIRSRKTGSGNSAKWDRPEFVSIQDCVLEGAMRIWGMGINHQGEDLLEPSREEGFVELVRANAPRHIELRGITFRGQERTPLYLAPGTTYVKLIDSTFKGTHTSVALYMDAQSGFNTITGNNFDSVSTRRREVIANDGSEKNVISGNTLRHLENGGIYLYRNCGEGEIIRHMPPRENRIFNNVFYYGPETPDREAVFLGSRSAKAPRYYCDYDKGYPLGSSADDRDFAQNNIVEDNVIYNRDPEDVIVSSGDPADTPNTVRNNRRADGEVAE